MSTPENSDTASTESSSEQEPASSPPDEVVVEELDDEALPSCFKPVHRVNDDVFSVAEIPICDLHEPEYDPRKSLDPNEVAARAEAIAKPHGHVDLIVREIEETVDGSGPTQYEVIKERRDLAALHELHGEDSNQYVPCMVREVNDRTAMLLMLSAHDWQVGFTDIEKARVYAKLISVTYRDGEQSLEAYLDTARSTEGKIELPSNVHSEVEALAEDLRPGPYTIARRLRLLLLPEQVQPALTSGDLPLRVAETIVDGLRDLKDPVARREHMLELATHGYSKNTMDELTDRIETICQSQEHETAPEKRVEELEEKVSNLEASLRGELSDVINFYNGHELPDTTLSHNGLAEPLEKAESVCEACEIQSEHIKDERIDPLVETKGAREHDRAWTETNLTERRDDRSDCPYCGQTISDHNLRTRIKHLDQQITEVTEQISTLRSDRKQFGKKAHKIEDLSEQLASARSQLEQARASRSETDGTADTSESESADAC